MPEPEKPDPFRAATDEELEPSPEEDREAMMRNLRPGVQQFLENEGLGVDFMISLGHVFSRWGELSPDERKTANFKEFVRETCGRELTPQDFAILERMKNTLQHVWDVITEESEGEEWKNL